MANLRPQSGATPQNASAAGDGKCGIVQNEIKLDVVAVPLLTAGMERPPRMRASSIRPAAARYSSARSAFGPKGTSQAMASTASSSASISSIMRHMKGRAVMRLSPA